MRQNTIPVQRILSQLQNDNSTLKEQISTFSNIHASKNAQLSILIHCCFNRLHQILISVIPYINMSPGEYNEVSQLTYELLRAVQQIRSTNNVSSFV